MECDRKKVDVGDKVVLNSGGHEMVVTKTSDTARYVTCQWVAADGSPQITVLPEVCVQAVIH